MSRAASGREWNGFYRGKVVETDIEGNDYGAVRVFVPDLFISSVVQKASSGFDENSWGLIAYPANNNMGGYNTDDLGGDSHYQANVHVPLKYSWVWVFFEGGDPARPFYTSSFMYKNAKLPPECRGLSEPHKSVLLCKTHSGRSIVVCDSPDQERIEIMGKKRMISGGPEGDSGSAYTIDGNATTILFDERGGSEKILIRSHKGDFINIDVQNRQLQMYFQSNIILKTDANLIVDVGGSIITKCGGNASSEVGGNKTEKIKGDSILQTEGIISSKSGDNTSIDAGGIVHIQLPSAKDAPPSVALPPIGSR